MCFKWHSVALGFGGSEKQSGPPCHLSSQCAVGGEGQAEYKGANEVTKLPLYEAMKTAGTQLKAMFFLRGRGVLRGG